MGHIEKILDELEWTVAKLKGDLTASSTQASLSKSSLPHSYSCSFPSTTLLFSSVFCPALPCPALPCSNPTPLRSPLLAHSHTIFFFFFRGGMITDAPSCFVHRSKAPRVPWEHTEKFPGARYLSAVDLISDGSS